MNDELTLEQHRELRDAWLQVVERWIDSGMNVPQEMRDAYEQAQASRRFTADNERRDKFRIRCWDD